MKETRDNDWVTRQLRELAARLDLEGAPHRPRAYRRAAETIDRLRKSVAQLRASNGPEGLDRLPGVGPHIAALVCELIDTGSARELERLREKTPVEVTSLLAVHGLGPKTLRLLWERLGVRTLDDLERALDAGQVEELPGFGKRRAQTLRETVRIRRRGRARVPRREAAVVAERLRRLLASAPAVRACSIAGSLRRRRPTVGDIDLVVASDDPRAAASCLLELPNVVHIYERGPQRVSVRLEAGIDVDLRVVAPMSFGSALLYFTGSRAHVVALRRLALAQGLRLNEYGLFRGRERLAGETEEEIYEALSLPYLAPPEREGTSVIRDSLRRRHDR